RPSAAIVYPTGCCIHALEAVIKAPEAHVPSHTMKAENQCIFCPKTFSPNKKIPRKADSRKKAKAPSIARVCAMISPEKAEKRAQLVPNWNSMGIPDTTPMTKAMAKIMAQKRAPVL